LYDDNFDHISHKPPISVYHCAQKFQYNFRLKVKRILIVAKLEYEVRRILIMHTRRVSLHLIKKWRHFVSSKT